VSAGAEDLLVGTWRVLAVEHTADDGGVGRPFGDRPQGLILYTPERYMSAILMRPDRPPFAAGDVLGGTEAEKAAAFGSSSAFGGRWEIVGDEIVHHLEVTTFPNWVGTDQPRRFDLTDTHLTLYPPPMLMEGRLRRARVHCERIVPPTSAAARPNVSGDQPSGG